MTRIGAFLAGRVTDSADGDKLVCLDPWCFAAYVLRVCRALTGSKTGGFLDKLAKSSWEGFDGEALKKGLAFLLDVRNLGRRIYGQLLFEWRRQRGPSAKHCCRFP